MKIVKAHPPNYEQIIAAIPAVKSNSGIIFTYGDTLYVPSGVDIPDHLMAHEETHTVQQEAIGINEWWEQYLADPAFRLKQEVEAYRKQYRVLCQNYPRHARRFVLLHITADLAGSMYGGIVNKDEAKKLITGGSQL